MTEIDFTKIAEIMCEHGITVSVAESCTGGLLAKKLTDIPGASKWFRGGVVAYDNNVKKSLLNISEYIIKDEGPVSETVASYMATGIAEKMHTTISVSTTGNAGPTTQDGEVGDVWISVSDTSRERTIPLCMSHFFQFTGDRESVRKQAADMAMILLSVRIIEIYDWNNRLEEG